MTYSVYVPIAICLGLGFVAPWLSTRLPPASGTWVVATATAAGGLSTLWTLGLLALSLVDDVPGLDGEGPLGVPVPDAVSALAAIGLSVLLWRLVGQVRRHSRLRRELGVVLTLPGPDLVVLPDPQARAFAVPGRPGRIVVTDTMLRALNPAQRRVLMAHERAHLDAAHDVALSFGRLGAAANPLLRPAARAVSFLSERHADERAATAVGDRELAAEALAAAALATIDQPPAGEAAPCFHQVGVVDRVAALQRPRSHGLRLGLPVALAATGFALIAVADATDDFLRVIGPLFGR